jgi:hypothetical protein
VSLFFDGINQVKEEKKHAQGTNAVKSEVKVKQVLITIVLSIAYFYLMRIITFIPSTILYLGGMILFLGEKRYWLIASIAIISSLSIYGLFALAFGVMLP